MQLKLTVDPPSGDPARKSLIELLKSLGDSTALKEATVYHQFPLYKDEDGDLVQADVLVVAPGVGAVVFLTTNWRESEIIEKMGDIERRLSRVTSHLYSRLLRIQSLRKSPKTLKFEVLSVIYAPSVADPSKIAVEEEIILVNRNGITELLDRGDSPNLDINVAREVCSAIEGARGLIRAKVRQLPAEPNSLGKQVEILELSIAEFEQQQFRSASSPLGGPQRLRGIAGSGKTVILAMKTALMHLRFPQALILYTFCTKSLYQLIKMLITRFYRQFDERDPDWDRIHIMHAWGGSARPGVYSEACREHGVQAIPFRETPVLWRGGPFDFVCQNLLESTTIQPKYDYIMVDEGQDFPPSFLRLCSQLAKEQKFIWAYDELQTIFQSEAPSPIAIFGKGPDGRPLQLEEDIILYKCYRNPREVLVCAHALGFGIYGPQIRQMLENEGAWQDIGYEVRTGDFKAASNTVIHRPSSNSVMIISELSPKESIVSAKVLDSFEHETDFVVNSVLNDLSQGLRPDDILVVSVDDRKARQLFLRIEQKLAQHKILCNNVHADVIGMRDFQMENKVTLSTVHKAKGNESYVVYVAGVDALFPNPSVRLRNMLFTAMTRAKAWLRISGVGERARDCEKEIAEALKNCPNLVFKYPTQKDIRIIKRDLAEAAIEKMEYERLIELMIERFGAEEVARIVRDKSSSPRNHQARKKNRK